MKVLMLATSSSTSKGSPMSVLRSMVKLSCLWQCVRMSASACSGCHSELSMFITGTDACRAQVRMRSSRRSISHELPLWGGRIASACT